MEKLQIMVVKLHRFRWFIALLAGFGFCATGLTLFFVPSNLGFALAGPLVIVPWSVMSVSFSRNPSDHSLLFALFCIGAGLAWPVIVLVG